MLPITDIDAQGLQCCGVMLRVLVLWGYFVPCQNNNNVYWANLIISLDQ